MYEFRVNDRIYKIKFGYGVLYKTDLIDRVVNVGGGVSENPAGALKSVIGLTAELLLAGLQKKHGDEFGYESDSEKEAMILKVCDLIDDYEDEHTESDGTRSKSGYTLFNELQAELEKNGFLSAMSEAGRTAAKAQDATIIPMDHQKKNSKVGEKK